MDPKLGFVRVRAAEAKAPVSGTIQIWAVHRDNRHQVLLIQSELSKHLEMHHLPPRSPYNDTMD
ncbi:hypothetical protein PHLCEN_2v6099 [Hermanssonia centrifuga]|uniref:Uncharacterized protein n=1 Tax=Hermanssonia centrifuga TaxID=98765 RepID=A0A2R6P0H1_9APHY|nr:hypothetical protein PHLCEN_2v6099 [Hermanssonia centrifuga]